MPKKKIFNQQRTVDFEITTVVSVDIDSLRLRLNHMDNSRAEEKVEHVWSELLKGAIDEPQDEEAFLLAISSIIPSLVKSRLIPDSLRVTSVESFDFEDGEGEDDS